jgi:hypothetical protein
MSPTTFDKDISE